MPDSENETYSAEEWREADAGQPSEREMQKAITEWAEYQPGLESLLFAIPNGQYRPGQRPEAGMKAGMPDLCLPVPSGQHGSLYIELKTPSGRVRQEQKEMIERLRDAGNRVSVCRSVDDALSTITEYIRQ